METPNPDRPTVTFRVSSGLAASADEVWARASTLQGVNDELWPIVRMTRPHGAREGALREGALGRSWLLLAGVVPFDFDDLTLIEVVAGRGFRERSRLGSTPRWDHDRDLRPIGERGCRVVDTITFAPAPGPVGGLQHFAFEATFRWRHRRLRRRFGSVG